MGTPLNTKALYEHAEGALDVHAHLGLVEVVVVLLNREALAEAARVRGQAPVGALVRGVADQEVAVGEPVRRERVVLRGRAERKAVACTTGGEVLKRKWHLV